MKTLHIAIVDDDIHIRQIVEAYLKKEGYVTTAVESAEEAITLEQENPTIFGYWTSCCQV